jgi:hypothetical protein
MGRTLIELQAAVASSHPGERSVAVMGFFAVGEDGRAQARSVGSRRQAAQTVCAKSADFTATRGRSASVTLPSLTSESSARAATPKRARRRDLPRTEVRDDRPPRGFLRLGDRGHPDGHHRRRHRVWRPQLFAARRSHRRHGARHGASRLRTSGRTQRGAIERAAEVGQLVEGGGLYPIDVELSVDPVTLRPSQRVGQQVVAMSLRLSWRSS